MSATAEATYVCEICSTPLRNHGGPHPPRWCADHRKESWRHEQCERNRKHRETWATPEQGPAVFCDLCSTRLLKSVADGLCGFCRVESALPSSSRRGSSILEKALQPAYV